MDDLGVPPFQETSVLMQSRSLHVGIYPHITYRWWFKLLNDCTPSRPQTTFSPCFMSAAGPGPGANRSGLAVPSSPACRPAPSCPSESPGCRGGRWGGLTPGCWDDASTGHGAHHHAGHCWAWLLWGGEGTGIQRPGTGLRAQLRMGIATRGHQNGQLRDLQGPEGSWHSESLHSKGALDLLCTKKSALSGFTNIIATGFVPNSHFGWWI